MMLPTSIVQFDVALLKELVERILTVKHPMAIILFGSRAREMAHSASDLDLLIVERENDLPRHRRTMGYRMALRGIDHDIDIVVYTLQEIDEWAAVPNAFITSIKREGKILYEDRGGFSARLAG